MQSDFRKVFCLLALSLDIESSLFSRHEVSYMALSDLSDSPLQLRCLFNAKGASTASALNIYSNNSSTPLALEHSTDDRRMKRNQTRRREEGRRQAIEVHCLRFSLR